MPHRRSRVACRLETRAPRRDAARLGPRRMARCRGPRAPNGRCSPRGRRAPTRPARASAAGLPASSAAARRVVLLRGLGGGSLIRTRPYPGCSGWAAVSDLRPGGPHARRDIPMSSRRGEQLLERRPRAPARTGTTRCACSRAAGARGRPSRRRDRRPGSRCARGSRAAASASWSSSPRPRSTWSSRSRSSPPASRLKAIAWATERRLCEAIATRTRRAGVEQPPRQRLEVAVAVGLVLEHRRRPAVLAGLDELVVPVGALDEPDGQRRRALRGAAPTRGPASSCSGESRR